MLGCQDPHWAGLVDLWSTVEVVVVISGSVTETKIRAGCVSIRERDFDVQ